MYEGGWVSELEVREKGMRETGRREEGGNPYAEKLLSAFSP